MPSARTKNVDGTNRKSSSQSTNAMDNITSLRRKCPEKGLATHGRKNALVARLQNRAAENENFGMNTASS